MQRYDTFLEQLVTSDEVDQWMDGAEAADQALAGALGLSGLAQNGAVTEKSGTPNLSVDVSGPLVAYDASGNRIAVAALTNVPVSLDENSVSTTVVTGGHERYLSIFVTFARSLTDPRLDGAGATVFYNRAESYSFQVVQAASAPLGTASRPALRAGSVLLADVKLINGQTSVLNADISTTRTQYVHVLTGTPKSVGARTAKAAMQLLEDQINDIINGVVTIAASSVNYAGGAAWLDGLTNPAASVEAQFDKIITDLSDVTGTTSSGASRIGFAPQGTIAATNVQAALKELSDEKAALAGATFTGAVVGNTTITAPDGGFRYPTPLTRSQQIALQHGTPIGGSINSFLTMPAPGIVAWTLTTAGAGIHFPVNLPNGAVFTNVTVTVQQMTAGAPGQMSIKVWKYTPSTTSVGAAVQLGSTMTFTAGTGFKVEVASFSTVIDNISSSYFIEVIGSASATATDEYLHNVSVVYDDVGPAHN